MSVSCLEPLDLPILLKIHRDLLLESKVLPEMKGVQTFHRSWEEEAVHPGLVAGVREILFQSLDQTVRENRQ